MIRTKTDVIDMFLLQKEFVIEIIADLFLLEHTSHVCSIASQWAKTGTYAQCSESRGGNLFDIFSTDRCVPDP